MTVFIVMFCEKGLTIVDSVFSTEDRAKRYIEDIRDKKPFFYITRAILQKR